MARKKVWLRRIADDATRRATFKKRKQSLLKKVSELATLCSIDACVVVYGPEEEAPEVWPSPAEAARVAARFRATPELYQSLKKTDQEGFLRQQAAKLREQLSRQERDNRELEASLLMHEVLSGGGWRMCDVGVEQAAELVRLAEMKLVLVRNRIEREKARAAMEPLRQAVEQAVGMAEPDAEEEQELMALCSFDEEAGDQFVEKIFGTVPSSCLYPESLSLEYPPWQASLSFFDNFELESTSLDLEYPPWQAPLRPFDNFEPESTSLELEYPPWQAPLSPFDNFEPQSTSLELEYPPWQAPLSPFDNFEPHSTSLELEYPPWQAPLRLLDNFD